MVRKKNRVTKATGNRMCLPKKEGMMISLSGLCVGISRKTTANNIIKRFSGHPKKVHLLFSEFLFSW